MDPQNPNPPQTPAPAAPAPALFDTLIPEDLKDRGYLADLKGKPVGPETFNALFKKLDGAQTLIGKKTGVPAADAPAEEWEKFHATLRPAKAEDYELPVKEGSTPDPEVQKAVKEIFHKAGLSKTQVAKLLPDFEAFVESRTKPQRDAAAAADAEFDTMVQKAFGAERDTVMARSTELLKALAPAEMAPFLNRLPNESLVLLAGVMENVRAKFMKEDDMGGGNGGGAPVDIAALREEARTLMALPAYKDAFHKDHATTKAKVDAIYSQISKAPKK